MYISISIGLPYTRTYVYISVGVVKSRFIYTLGVVYIIILMYYSIRTLNSDKSGYSLMKLVAKLEYTYNHLLI